MATFRPISCLVANAVSKGTLRCALDEALDNTDEDSVYYFPSYELALCSGVNPFKDDNRHIKLGVVNGIMTIFERYFCVA